MIESTVVSAATTLHVDTKGNQRPKPMSAYQAPLTVIAITSMKIISRRCSVSKNKNRVGHTAKTTAKKTVAKGPEDTDEDGSA